MRPGHGITIGDCHTFDDWGLVPTQRPSVQPPTPVYKYLSVPGGMDIDLTEALNGLNYEMRRDSWEFYLRPRRTWATVLSGIMNRLHGKAVHVILDDNDSWYYSGRVAVNEFRSEEQESFLVLDYCLEPYKYERWTSLEDWMWDPFEFDIQSIRELAGITVPAAENEETPGTVSVEILSTHKPAVPAFILKSGSSVKASHTGAAGGAGPVSSEVDLEIGTAKMLPSLTVFEADETVTFTNAGGTEAVVDILLRDGSL